MDWNFATTLIGSLPFANSIDSVDITLDGRVACPSWPQLPTRGINESMYVQTGAYLPGLKIDGDKIIVDLNDYDPTEAYTAILSDDIGHFIHPPELYEGMYEFLNRDLSKYDAVKGQVTGPISEGLQILDKNSRPVIYDESYSEIVRKTVNMMAKWQARRLSMSNNNVIIFFDEPSLSILGTPFASISDDQARAWINESMDGVDAFRGIHCCGNTNWAMILSTDIDILSFDAYNYGDNLLMYPDELTDFLSKGKCIAWGIIPNSDDSVSKETVDTIVARLESLFDKMEEKGINRKKVAHQSMITPQCGLSGLTEENAKKVFDLLDGVSKEMKRRYGF